MPQILWPSFTLVLTAERPQDINRPPLVIRILLPPMEPTAPANLMRTVDYRWEPLLSTIDEEYNSDEVCVYSLRNDSSTRTYVSQGDDDDDAQTIFDEPTIRRGFFTWSTSSKSLKAPLSKSWNIAHVAALLGKLSSLKIRQRRPPSI